MRLYVVCPDKNQRIYLSIVVQRRSEVDEIFTVRCPYDGQTHAFRRGDVEAEPSLGASIGSAIIGGLIGALVAGPLGAILGGGAGLAVGNNAEEEERRKVRQFYEE